MQKLQRIVSLPALAFALGIAAYAVPAAASDADLGPYFERLRTAPPQTTPVHRYRPQSYYSYQRREAAPQPARPVHRASYTTGTLDIGTLEHTVFNHINIYRLSKGLRPLDHHGGLAGTARSHAQQMATGSAAMSHAGMRERLMPHMGHFGYRAGGEILAYNRNAGDPAQTAMRSWINSYRHKDVMEEDYTAMGVGVAQRADGAYYFTVLFVR
jgi:uncharacterized protein YkwD